MNVVVVGGGVIGLCCAYYLSEAGFAVTVIDRDHEQKESCSDKNAGMIVPSHFIPLAAPGVVTQGLKWMFDRRSPFYLRPRLDPKLWIWCWHFLRHCNRKHVENTRELLRDMSLESRSEFVRLSETLDFPLVKKGLLMLCKTDHGLAEETEVAEQARQLGIEAEACSPERLQEIDPDIQMNVCGGVWYPQDCHLDSELFLDSLRNGIVTNGGEFQSEEVTNFEYTNDRVHTVATQSGQTFKADSIVMCGGAWTPDIAKKLGVTLPMQAGKGYSFTLEKPTQLPKLCSLLKEGRAAVTPMGKRLRVAGTMEICGNNLAIDNKRAEGIVNSFCQFFPAFETGDFADQAIWSGLRPCTPDGLPYIGKLPSFKNLVVATGHSMLGLSLGPITGKIVRDLHKGEHCDERLDVLRNKLTG